MNEQGMSQNGWIESPERNADGSSLTALDVKITDLFPGVTVRKDLVNKVKGNALVPSYVLEFLLSAYATNTDQASIESGVDRVRAILANNYVHREEANLIQSKIREKGSHRIIVYRWRLTRRPTSTRRHSPISASARSLSIQAL